MSPETPPAPWGSLPDVEPRDPASAPLGASHVSPETRLSPLEPPT